MESTTRTEPIDEFGIELIREWVPDDPKGAIVLVHGLGEHCGRYEQVGGSLADAGYTVRAFDLVGFGGSGGRRAYVDEWSDYQDQVERHIGWARDTGLPVVLMGYSMGGLVATSYVLDNRTQPDYLVVSAPSLAGGNAFLRVAAYLASRVAPKLTVPNPWKGHMLSRDPRVGETYYADPLVQVKTSARLGNHIYEIMRDTNERLDEIDVPTLVLHGGADSIVPPQSTAPMGELPNVDRRLYPGLRHEVLNEPEGPEVLQDILDWLDERV